MAGSVIACALAVLAGAWLPGMGVPDPAHAQSDTDLPDVGCTDCHRDHSGRGGSLTAIGDSSCQACHAEVEGFPAGHPEYEDYPYDRRTRINFDHVGHERKYFEDADEADVPQDCVQCHEPDPRREQMLVSDFQTACGACHAGEIHGEGIAGPAGIAFITVPGLDLPTLREQGAAIGEWPELSDRKLTPFMRAMLSRDRGLRDALTRFDQLDPLDLRDASAEDIEAVTQIAWATKALFYDLIAEGPAALHPQLNEVFGTEVDGTAVRAMLGNMPLATLRGAQAEWFPNLFQDVAGHDAGETVPIPPSEFSAPAETEPQVEGVEAGQESILGDDTEDSQASILGDESEPSQASILGDDEEGEQADILGGDPEDSQDSILGEDAGVSQESILGDDDEGDQADILGGESEGSQADILSGDEDAGSADILSGDSGSDDGGLFGSDADEGAETAPSRAATPPEPNPEEWSRLGGWYRDYFAMQYRPGDHADPFIENWMNLSVAAINNGAGSFGMPILNVLTDDDAPGKCMKCHTVDAEPDGTVSLNWRDRPRTPGVKLSARFAHAPHLQLLKGERNCALCHDYNREADYLAGFDDRDPMTYQPNFHAVTRQTCAECHVEDRAGDTCVQCHDYHVGHVAERK